MPFKTNLLKSALVVHDNLNAGGGGERLAVVTIEALNELGFQVDIATITNPDLEVLQEKFGHGTDLIIRDIKPLEIEVDSLTIKNIVCSAIDEDDYDLIINTHADLLIYYNATNSHKEKLKITYCHYPLVPSLVQSGKYAHFMNLFGATNEYQFPDSINLYKQMMLNTKVLTNSEYSKSAIKHMYNVEPIILYPPVDVERFGQSNNNKSKREDIVLVLSRFSPDKDIARAIHIAKLLRDRNIGKNMIIVGNVASRDNFFYLYELVDLLEKYDLEDYVKLKFNAPLEELLDLMQQSKVYLHPLAGEPFGISIAEAMAAGLIPVVPNVGGSTEFVPTQYQFGTDEEAVDIIESAMKEDIDMTQLVSKFSTQNYKDNLKTIISSLFCYS